jgi:phosphatidylserine/phosphatidylglycerophosphate/cardiolipin synthase-like enzyme
MPAKKINPVKSSVVIANNDIVYLWWTVKEKIDNCLGFSIHRIVDGKLEKKGLMATVGFDAVKDNRKSPQTTDEWPIQSFNWKDVYAPVNKKLQYKIIPMTGTWDDLKPQNTLAITTDEVSRTQSYGNSKVIFNRGFLSTQAFTKDIGANKKKVRDEIEVPGTLWRKRLGGQVIFNATAFFKQVKDNGGKLYAALYELTDTQLIDEIKKSKGIELILSNANGSEEVTVDGEKKTKTINDKTNLPVRAELHKLMQQGKLKIYDRMLGSHIGHNKFVVYVDKNGKAKSVLTGSTNWTATGLCGQTNNMIIIDDDAMAKHYLAYWNKLKQDNNQDAELRDWCAKNKKSFVLGDKQTKITTWFSPNTVQKNKTKDAATPVDINDVFELIQKAKKSILFLVFNPGSPSIIDEIKRVADARPKTNPLFVRGAISDAKMAKQVINTIYSRDINEKPSKYTYDNTQITGVAAIPGDFSYWEKELLKLGFATIHDKILVIDPFEKECVVVTGSHNLGYKASYTNDENMLIVQKNNAIANAYAAHVLDVVNHFKWRYKLQEKIRKANAKTAAQIKKALETAWKDLNEKDEWMNYYFGASGFKSNDKLFLR